MCIGQSESCAGANNCPFYEEYILKNPKAVVVGSNGAWYDITSFVPKHPGGDFISLLGGRDVTELIKAFHERDVLRGRQPIGHYNVSNGDPAAKIFADLRRQLVADGFWETNYTWYFTKMIIPFIILFGVGAVAWHANLRITRGAPIGSLSVVMELILAGVLVGNFWQQCGFLMHDLMHNCCFHNRLYDQFLGRIFGTVCIGVGSCWWRDEHFQHHAFTNVFSENPLYYDPQMREDVWMQDEILKPSYRQDTRFIRLVQWVIFRIQHIWWAPICLFVGRIGIMVDGMSQERRLTEWMGWIIHWAWSLGALYALLPVKAALILYATAAIYQGVLHLQLVLSHYAMPWTQLKDLGTDIDWHCMQVRCCLNIVNPIYTDWFHGGLNFHIEHHLFPTMPRHNLRAASKYVREACKKAGLEYQECTLFEAFCRTFLHLWTVGSRQTLEWSEPNLKKVQ